MFLPLLMMAPDVGVTTGGYVDAPVPAFSAGPSVASTGRGSCRVATHTVLTAASLRLSWSVTPGYAGVYAANVYEDEILVASNVTTGIWDKTIEGQIENGNHGVPAGWNYRVDIVRIDTGAVVATASAPTWQMWYGDCTITDNL